MTKALPVINIQVGLFERDPPRHDVDGVIRRVNEITKAVRNTGGIVIFIQHEGDGSFTPGFEGWEILPSLEGVDRDLLLHKQACDSFYETELPDVLEQRGAQEIIITGYATDFCVDTTIRTAANGNYEVVVGKDGHTTKDGLHFDEKSIIVSRTAHHPLQRTAVAQLIAACFLKYRDNASQSTPARR